MTQIANRAMIARDQRGSLEEEVAVTERPASAGHDVREVLGNLPQWEGAGATDFTVYTRKDLTVRRGEKVIVTLFTRKIKYTHQYRWSPPDTVQHVVLLQNTTDSAWTTGPCLALTDNNPLSEDLLKYVAKGGIGELPVTTAINIATDRTEEEAARKVRALELGTNDYADLVTLQGELKLRNFEKKVVDMVISAHVPGKPVEASDSGKLSSDATKLQLLDRAGTVEWSLKLDPGATKTLTYKYERYVRTR